VATKYGFEQISTPLVEDVDLFIRAMF